MLTETQAQLSTLYDADYQNWIQETVARLKARDFSRLDLDHLIEEIESLGKSDRRALYSYVLRLCEHLLKLKYWESERERCFRGWVLEINHFRAEIALILKDSPSLKPALDDAFASAYPKARKALLKAMVCSLSRIPTTADFTLDQALDEDWLP